MKVSDAKRLSEPQEIKEPLSVGKEFIEWAEKYWALDKIITIQQPDKFAEKICDYEYMRNIFIQKINSIIRDRIGN